MPVYRARWILPVVSRPVRDGWLQVEGGRLVAIGDALASPPASPIELGERAILPGLVNAHTHLELSGLRGLVPPAVSLPDWIRSLLTVWRERPAQDLDAVRRAVAEARAAGTSALADISNTLATVDVLRESRVHAVVFHELLGFNVADASERASMAAAGMRHAGGSVRVALGAHSPYSVSPDLLRAIRAEAVRHDDGLCAVHLAESAEEVEFIQSGSGPFRVLLEDLGVWNSAWVTPGTTPATYLDMLGFLGPGLLAVHGTQLTAADLELLRARGVTLVTCPRSNAWTGAGSPPVDAFFRAGVRVAVGTDSLTSSPDLNVFEELREMRRLAPAVPAAALIESATRIGADALRLPGLGRIEPGARAELIAVQLPAAIDDVEEYLVNGIMPGQIGWIKAVDG